MQIYIIVAGFILADVVTGILQAVYNKDVNSTKLRQGLYHKLSEILSVVLATGLEYACQYVELGVDVPVLSVVSIYICVMELVSILENLCNVNPKLAKLFKPYLEKLNSDEEEE